MAPVSPMATITIRTIPHRYDLTAPKPGRQILIFIHGWLLSRHYWQPLTQDLAQDYQCLSYDLRGFGDSQSVAPHANHTSPSSTHRQRFEAYSPLAYAKDIGDLMDGLAIENAWLVGHSLGGTLALWGAHYLGDRINGVVCLNSGGGIYLEDEFRTFRTVGQRLVKYRPRFLKHFPPLHWAFCYDSVPNPIPLRWGRQRVLDFMAADEEAALGALLASTTRTEVHRLPNLVSQLPQPVYFITGQQDTIMEPRYVRHLASYHPLFQNHSQNYSPNPSHGPSQNLIELEDCGHMAMVERPAAIIRHLRTILIRHPLPSPPSAPPQMPTAPAIL